MATRLHQQVSTIEPVVRFENDGWTRYLTLHGERAFVIGGGCDTCAFLFERKESSFLSPGALGERLADGVGIQSDDLLETVGSLLPTGEYAVVDFLTAPRLTGPCHPDDYFSHESLDLFGMPAYGGVPDNPRTPYWRTETRLLPLRPGTRPEREGPSSRPANPRHFFHFVVPLEPPHNLDPERVGHYRRQLEAGGSPVAFGVSVLDVRAPASRPWDKDERTYRFAEHWCLATYLLDGHHKVEAAARSNRAVRLLTFLARDASIASEDEIDAVVQALADG